MAGDVVERTPKTGQGRRRKKRRIPIRIDMTPMVDIAFLLLIFYMVSTVFAMPQAIRVQLPPDDGIVKVLDPLVLRVDANNDIWWNVGVGGTGNLPQRLPAPPGDSLQSLLWNTNRANPKLNTLVLVHPDSHYEQWVAILDHINLLERLWNAELARELGKGPDELTQSERFSYRYGMGSWNNGDTKLLSFAKEHEERKEADGE